MGLDMYLYAHKVLWKESECKNAELLTEDLITKGIKVPVRKITVEAAYWRKCWMINHWITERKPDGVTEECTEFGISRATLSELAEICTQALLFPNAPLPESLAKHINGEDQNHIHSQLATTAKQLTEVLKYPGEWGFTYMDSY